MRCPKCGFVSFDLIETCVKCGKNITKTADDLHGTVASVASPSFLKGATEETTADLPEETAVIDEEQPLDLGDEGDDAPDFDLGLDDEPAEEADEVELDLGEEEARIEEAAVEIDLGDDEVVSEDTAEIDLGEAEAISDDTAEIDLGLDDESSEQADEVELDLGEEDAIGISDLAPEEETPEVQIEETVEEEFEVAADEVEPESAGQGLGDLEVDGLDLETPDVDDSGKVLPSVKTGTALDDFDIDLGDLLTGKED